MSDAFNLPENWPQESDLRRLGDLIRTVYRLRAPGGCAWDRKQTHRSLRPYLVEEAYEVLDVLDQIEDDQDTSNPELNDEFREELGDLLMQVVLHSELTREFGRFDIFDVAQALNDKLVRRHPHVFGDQKADDAGEALVNWEQQKLKERKGKKKDSVLDGVPRSLPALLRSARVIEKVSRVGFQWSDLKGPLDKVREELGEFMEEVEKTEAGQGSKEKLADEFGDLLFTVCNVGHLMDIEPENALRGTLDKFERRFRHVEKRLADHGKTPQESNLEEMDGFWDEAKAKGL
jgi:tetrapyrrole methylase family protein/MazG family protein